jgi:hypothetical protein
MTSIVAILASLAIAGFCSKLCAATVEYKSELGVIFNDTYLKSKYEEAKGPYVSGSPFWIPAAKDIAILESNVEPFLQRQLRRLRIPRDATNYRFQYFGITAAKNKKLIFVITYCQGSPFEPFAERAPIFISGYDECNLYFYYSSATRRFSNATEFGKKGAGG